MFTQVHSKSERAQGGLGIGLALVRRLTEMHGGTVTRAQRRTRSRRRVHGPATGHVDAAEPAPESAGASRATIPSIEPQRILVADDNHDAAEALSLQLQLAGHDVRTAHDGVEALAVAKTFVPDIVLLDLGMPKMDGYEVARQLRLGQQERRMTLIALTGWGQQQDRDRTSNAGFDAHLVKPVAEAHLFKALAAAVEDKRRIDDAETG